MKAILGFSALALTLALATAPADAKGCIKGAVVGGVAGHYVHHHGVIGAAIGCAIGHHEANKQPASIRGSDPPLASIRPPDHSALIPASLMIGHHFSISAF